jgi:hypothetical protein
VFCNRNLNCLLSKIFCLIVGAQVFTVGDLWGQKLRIVTECGTLSLSTEPRSLPEILICALSVITIELYAKKISTNECKVDKTRITYAS